MKNVRLFKLDGCLHFSSSSLCILRSLYREIAVCSFSLSLSLSTFPWFSALSILIRIPVCSNLGFDFCIFLFTWCLKHRCVCIICSFRGLINGFKEVMHLNLKAKLLFVYGFEELWFLFLLFPFFSQINVGESDSFLENS